MPKKADSSLKQGKTYKSKLFNNAKYNGEGLDKYVDNGMLTPEEAKELKAKARKTVKLRMSGELKEAIEIYIADHSNLYSSTNDFICKTLEEKIKE